MRSSLLGRAGAVFVVGALAMGVGVGGLMRKGGGQPAPSARAAVTSTAPRVERKSGAVDPALTPGDWSPSGPHGAPSAELKAEVIRAYGFDPAGQHMVVVPLIPAALGGTSAKANLFPLTPWFADLKVKLDAELANEVTAGKVTADAARAELTSDWVAAMHRHGVRNYGAADPKKAREIEQMLRW